ncbi:PH domain-containing protein [Herbiconiux sp. P15]|uniref:PH domain-containing protein n=1 Tax=Herbiconiux liukaitaii TaxID=3342799 RepID=UPI0035BB47B8
MTPPRSSDATERFGWGAARAADAATEATTRYPTPPQAERVPYPPPPPYPGAAPTGEPGFSELMHPEPDVIDAGYADPRYRDAGYADPRYRDPVYADHREPGFADLGFDDTDPGTAGHEHPGYGGYTTSVDPTPEVILVRARPHARRLTVPVLILFATAAAFGWFGGRFPEEWQNWAALAGACALVFFGTLLPFFAWLGHRYTVTSRRVIARRGLFVRDRQDLYLARVTDVRLRRTPFQAAAASGDVRITAGPDLTVVLHDIPSARLTADLLGALTEHPTPTPHTPHN